MPARKKFLWEDTTRIVDTDFDNDDLGDLFRVSIEGRVSSAQIRDYARSRSRSDSYDEVDFG
jgi:hypothetical protein